MSADEELERAKSGYVERAKSILAKKIAKMTEEEFFPSSLRTQIRVLKIACAVAVFICGPIMGWLIAEIVRQTINVNMFIVYLLPMIFLGIITAIVLMMKTPPE